MLAKIKEKERLIIIPLVNPAAENWVLIQAREKAAPREVKEMSMKDTDKTESKSLIFLYQNLKNS